METEKQKQNYTGLDIGLESIDAAWYEQDKLHHVKVPNTLQGFKQLVKQCGSTRHYVMETTGPYYVALALHLHLKGIRVSVVNAMVIKRFIQMNLEKNKSDKKDAAWICKYAISQQPKLWQALSPSCVSSRMMKLYEAFI